MVKQRFPEPTVGALIFNPQGKIFLVKTHKWQDKYCIPGGHIELAETMEEALNREIKEETGLDVSDIKFLCFHEFVFEKTFWKKRHFIFLNFICKTRSKEVKLNNEAQGFIWATPKEALKLPLEFYTRKTIKEYMREFRRE